ncbi:hypothetical protein MKW98_022872 [Papaver atlanticum]|uniref:Uncharacterized protein n=1 Tax=Papaver atlanticum TaxID=357466 RepID=A0AAD4TM55_9MAGN|nr:hypothetical protein MKW98_022872 [Papaver atlanticum]
MTCVLWDVTTGQRVSVFGGELPSGHTADVLSVSINASDPSTFVSSSSDTTACLWDSRKDVNTVKFFPDGQRFGTGSDDGTCRLFDVRTETSSSRTSIAFSISGRLLFVGYLNGDCYGWGYLLAKVALNLGSLQKSHNGRISCLGLSADGSALCTGSWDRDLKNLFVDGSIVLTRIRVCCLQIWAFGGHGRAI